MNNENKSRELFNKAAEYCSRAEKCPEDVKQLLRKYSDDESIIETTIKVLESEGYINIERYIKAFINDKFRFEKWGRIKIEYALNQKKLPSEIIKRFLNEIDKEEYLDILKNLINGKIRQNKENDPAKKKAALIRFALSKGFEYEIIFKVLEQ
jgi:regulatory protein